MADSVSELAAKGAALSPEERSRLIDLLLVTLQEAPLAKVEAAWDEEVERRLDAYDRGETPSIDGEEVLAEAHRLARWEASDFCRRLAGSCSTKSATTAHCRKGSGSDSKRL